MYVYIFSQNSSSECSLWVQHCITTALRVELKQENKKPRKKKSK